MAMNVGERDRAEEQECFLTMEDSGIDSDPKHQNMQEDGRLFTASDSSCSSTTVPSPQKTNVKQLHKKLEQRIEQAKKIQRIQEYKDYKKNSTLIPIQRLPIPSKSTTVHREQQPLVDWETDESIHTMEKGLPTTLCLADSSHISDLATPLQNSSDEDINFFPLSRMKDGKQELTDTFSIEDFEVSPDEDDLNLLPPKPMYQRCVCCIVPVDWKCTLM